VKIRPLRAKSVHVDGWTDGYDEPNSCFCIFMNICKSEINWSCWKPRRVGLVKQYNFLSYKKVTFDSTFDSLTVRDSW